MRWFWGIFTCTNRSIMKKILFLAFIAASLLQVNKVSAQTPQHYYLKGNALNENLMAQWGPNTDGTGIPPANFIGTGIIWHWTNRSAATLTVNFGAAASTCSVEANMNLTVIIPTSPAFANLKSPVAVDAGGTLTIANNKTIYNFSNLHLNSTVVYSSSTKSVQTNGTTYGNLKISTTTSLEVGATSYCSVAGSLIINPSQTLRMSGGSLELYGTVVGSGNLRGNSASYIALLGGNGGNNGTLNFETGFENLLELALLYPTATDMIVLGTNLNLVSGGDFFHQSGILSLNGNTLTILSGASFEPPALASDGYVRSTSASALIIAGDVGLYTGFLDLFMDPSNNTLGTLQLNSATAVLNAGNALNINNTLDITGGATFNTNNNVTLVSTNALKGRLADITNGTLGGNLTVQTFARGNTTDWANLGISGIQSQTFNNWYGQIPMAIEGSTTGVTSVSNTYFESVQSWFESSDTYDTTLTVTSPITPGKGYWVYLGTALNTTADMVWSVSGTPVTGNVSIPVTSSGAGWNLVSNPYPSPIDWNNVMGVTGNAALVNDAYYIYDAELGNTVSYVSGVATPASYQTMTNVIPMGQAFYVEAIGAGNLTVIESCKSDKNTNANELLKSNSNSNSISSLFRLNIDGGGYHDDAVIRFHSNATSSFDKALDARKLYNSPGYVGYPGTWGKRTVIATQSNNEDYSINSLPYAQTQNAVIPVIARVYTTGQYTISGTDIQNLPPNACVILKDKLLNTTQDLRLGSYICNIVDTTIASRFELTVCADVTADVKSQPSVQAASSILINKDAQGIFVDFDFKNTTKANITVTNILGQKIMDAKKVKVTNDNVYLDINVNDQLIFVTVETDNEKVTKKFINFR